MRLLAACAALIGAASFASVPDAAPASFRFEPLAIAAGDRTAHELRWHSELTYRIEQAGAIVQAYAEVEGLRRDATIEIVAVDDAGPSVVRVDVATATSSENDGEGGAREERLPIARTTFEARKSADAWAVVDADAHAVSSTVAALVLRAADVEGARCLPVEWCVARELAGRDLSVGVPIELSPACARALLGRDSEVLSISGVLAPAEIRDVEGAPARPFRCTFEIVLESIDAGALDARATLAGELVLDPRTGRMRSLDLAGETRVAAAASGESAVEITAEGPWTVSRRARSLAAR